MGPICLGANEHHIYPNMCAIFGYGPTVVSREKGGTDTLTASMNGYRITSAIYISEKFNCSTIDLNINSQIWEGQFIEILNQINH